MGKEAKNGSFEVWRYKLYPQKMKQVSKHSNKKTRCMRRFLVAPEELRRVAPDWTEMQSHDVEQQAAPAEHPAQEA